MKLSLQEVVGKHYADFWHCKKRYRVCKGSRGSKKSKTTALNHVLRLYEYPQSNVLCVRRYANTLRDSMFSDIKWAINRLGLSDHFDVITSPMQITRRSTGQKILFRGLDDGQKLTSIGVPIGYLCFIWIEESYEVSNEDDFNKLDMSVRGEVPEGYFKQITLTFNPWSANSWLKARFFDNVDEDLIFTKTTTYQHNEWLDEQDRSLFEKMKINNPRRYLIEGEGEWGISEGLIYENFEVQEFDIQALRRTCDKSAFGLDFGFTDPNAFIGMMIDESKKHIYVFDEWYEKGVTNQRIARRIMDMGYGSEKIICDSAEPKSIEELRIEGLRSEAARKGKDSVSYGIQLIQNYKIIVHPKCTEFQKEISNYCWAKDKNGKPTDKPDHEFSHGMDAMRYGISKALVADSFSFD